MACASGLLAVALLAGLFAPPAAAQTNGAGPQQGTQQNQPATKKQQPTLLTADEMTYDKNEDIVTATGNVQITQGDRTLIADKVVYNKRTSIVTADGHVHLVEPDGQIIFGNHVELTDDFKEGFIESISVLFLDNSRFAAAEGERRLGRYTEMEKGVYSACELCKEDPTRPPVWQVKGVRIIHDSETHDVTFRDATMELFGVPVFYTPYLSGPDPTVDRRTGVIAPTFGSNSELGFIDRNYYYLDLGKDKDATVEGTVTTNQGPVLGGQYRQRFDNGRLSLSGSITEGDLVTSAGTTEPNRVRGHLFSEGRFDLNDQYRWGFDAAKASDNTYLQKYGYTRPVTLYDTDNPLLGIENPVQEQVLTSRAFIEGFRGRDYSNLSAYDFQDLRPPGERQVQPVVLPYGQYDALGEPGSLFGGRWSFDAGVLGLSRESGPDTRRASSEVGWQRQFTSDSGLMATVSGTTLVKGYDAVDPQLTQNQNFSGPHGHADTAQVFPQTQLTLQYPFIRQFGSVQHTIEPIVQFTAAPNASNDPNIPNEDSQDVFFDDTNLFSSSRFPGIDRLDGGERVAYGLRNGVLGLLGPGTGGATLFLGQSYSLHKNSAFPSGSGLENNRSDYVGRVTLLPAAWLNLSYGFRLDPQTFQERLQDAVVSAGVPLLNASVNYYSQGSTSGPNAFPARQDIIFGVSSKFTQYWTASATQIQAIEPSPAGPLATVLTLTYKDDCFTFTSLVRKYFTTQPDLGSGTTVLFRVALKNLGEFNLPTITGP